VERPPGSGRRDGWSATRRSWLYRRFTAFIEDLKAIMTEYEKEDRVWQIATKVVA